MDFYTISVLICLLTLMGACHGCNIDTSAPIRYSEGSGDYFGYTVLQHEDLSDRYILIGAPRGNSPDQPTLDRPGLVYKCESVTPYQCSQVQLDTTENEISGNRVDNKTDQWLGVSLSHQDKQDGLVTTCGHRYSNEFFLGDPDFEKDDRYPIGVCYSFKLRTFSATRFTRLEKTFPCLGNGINDQWRADPPYKDFRWLSWCQAGISAATTSDGNTVLYGAPGAYNWTGTVVPEVNNAINTGSIPERNVFTSDSQYKTDYVGYATAVGHFVGPPSAEQGVAGAPRANLLVGKVTIYEISNNTVYQELYGEPMSTYYGSAIAAVDVNGDQLDDLLVGAPLYSFNQDEGKVYVYLNTGSANEPLQLSNELIGRKAISARFGTSISSAGDLNQDGYNDVIIGAPYEDDGAGAIYIYFGGEGGIDPVYSQRIAASDVRTDGAPEVRTFGISVHGSLDIDGNRYPDVLIGAHESDSAFYLRAQPLIQLQAWLELTPQSVDPDVKTCSRNGADYVCIDVRACFHFTGLTVTRLLDIVFSIDVDEENVAAGIESRFLLEDEGKLVDHVEGVHGIPEDEDSCTSVYKTYLSERARDLLTPVPMKLTYDVFKYEVQTSVRGDEPYLFPGGIPPLSDSYNCDAETVTEEVIFVQNCGLDAVCQTDIVFTADVEQPGGKSNSLILGASPTLYFNAKIDNAGEEAHQTVLTVNHPSDIGYEGLEIIAVSCLQLADKEDCTPEVVAICTPEIGQDTSAIVKCNLGNPMNAYNSVSLRLRFDISDIPWSVDRVINITATVTTVSIEANLSNNALQLDLMLEVEADLAVVGGSQPEAVYYGYNATSMGYSDQKAADEAKLKLSLAAVDNFYEHDYDPSRYNGSHIGPAFNHEYQVVNFGRGRLPLTSDVTIRVPWRTQDEDMLIFIKAIKIDESQGSCNQAKILDLQRRRIEEFYQEGGSPQVSYSEEESKTSSTSSSTSENSDRQVRGYGLKDVLTNAVVMSDDKDGVHVQPDGHRPDEVTITTTAYTGNMGQGSIPWWVILLAVLLGLLFLIACVLILWKLGFFKRGMKEEMKSEYDAVATSEPE